MVLERASRDDVLLEVAFAVAKRGTCSRAQVGAVISRDGRIISTGYNGAPAGVPHCEHPHLMLESVSNGCLIAGHAEENAIAYAARFGVALDGAELHCTHAPCYACSRMIVNAGIVKVTYTIPYRKTEGIELLTAAAIKVTLLENDA